VLAKNEAQKYARKPIGIFHQAMSGSAAAAMVKPSARGKK